MENTAKQNVRIDSSIARSPEDAVQARDIDCGIVDSVDAVTGQLEGLHCSEKHKIEADGTVPEGIEHGTQGPSKLFVGNIPYKASKTILCSFFEQFGEVADTYIMLDKAKRSKGFGFVTFRDETGASRALVADGTPALELLGRQVRVSRAHQTRNASKAPPGGAEPLSSLLFHNLPLEILYHILSQLPIVEIIRAQRISRYWRDLVRKYLSLLAKFDLVGLEDTYSNPYRLDDASFKRLMKRMPNLRRLKLGPLTLRGSYKSLYIVANSCPKLIDIDLDGFAMNDRSLRHFCEQCPKLETVRLVSTFDECHVGTVLRNLSHLRRLALINSNTLTGDCFDCLPASMDELVLRSCRGLNSGSLALIRRCTGMLSLEISDCPQLVEQDYRSMLAGLPKLQRLFLSGQPPPFDRYLDGVSGTLRVLDLSNTTRSYGPDLGLESIVPLLPNITELSLDGQHYASETDLLQLVGLQQLSVLDVSHVRSVSDAVLDCWQQLPLTRLYLAAADGAADFTAAGLTRFVAGSGRLQLLDLSCVPLVTGQLLQNAVAQVPPARQLVIYAGGTDAVVDDQPYPHNVDVRSYNSVQLYLHRLAKLHLYVNHLW